MMNLNRVTITGNLTKDPELKMVGDSALAKMRVAVNGRKKMDNEWVDDANYFDVIVWGKQAENVAKYLAKGRGVAVDGRLNWREWETDDGSKRQHTEIVAQSVQFLNGGEEPQPHQQQEAPVEVPVAAAPSSYGDDVPF